MYHWNLEFSTQPLELVGPVLNHTSSTEFHESSFAAASDHSDIAGGVTRVDVQPIGFQ